VALLMRKTMQQLNSTKFGGFMKSWFLVLSILFFANAANAGTKDQTISAKSPGTLASNLTMMGYPSKQSKSETGNPILTIKTGDTETAIVFGGCEKELNCTYIAFVTSFTDVKNPPDSWLQKLNDEYDLFKVCLNEDKTVRISQGAVVEGLPISSFRTILDQWVAAIGTVARDAVKEKLIS
jgi:hypothetical protein